MGIEQGTPPSGEAPKEVLPVAEESLSVRKETVTTERVRISTRTHERTELAEMDLASEELDVVRVPIGREVSQAPGVRTEGEVTIIPVLEEVVVLEKRLVLREELHVRRNRHVETFRRPIALRTQEAVVERVPVNEERKSDDV